MGRTLAEKRAPVNTIAAPATAWRAPPRNLATVRRPRPTVRPLPNAGRRRRLAPTGPSPHAARAGGPPVPRVPHAEIPMYLFFKLVHVASVVMFLGNIVTGLFWHAHALRTGNARLIQHAMDGIIRSDRWFTIPGVVLIVTTGILAAIRAGLPLLRTPWIFWSIVLFALSGVLFGVWVAPLQKRLRALAAAGLEPGTFDLAAYRRLALRWEIAGIAALLTPAGAFVLMVLKPG